MSTVFSWHACLSTNIFVFISFADKPILECRRPRPDAPIATRFKTNQNFTAASHPAPIGPTTTAPAYAVNTLRPF